MSRRGSTINPINKFNQFNIIRDQIEGIDDWEQISKTTQFFEEKPKSILSKNSSEDISFDYSINPYQGCEHGCIYCYARNSHEYWGYSAGRDFESKIIVKKNAAELLERVFLDKKYKPKVIALSGNTDCYQPVERTLKITRQVLSIFLKYRNPVSIITKNSLILRDLDILTELAKLNLVHVSVSLTTLDEQLRRVMEPRTASSAKRLETINKLAKAGIPVNVMAAPIIPWLNHHEIPDILENSAAAGALNANYTVVRLNGTLGLIFEDWINTHFPQRASRVLNTIKSMHGGKVNDTDWGRRMKGDGAISDTIKRLFLIAKRKYFDGKSMPEYKYNIFRKNGHFTLFD